MRIFRLAIPQPWTIRSAARRGGGFFIYTRPSAESTCMSIPSRLRVVPISHALLIWELWWRVLCRTARYGHRELPSPSTSTPPPPPPLPLRGYGRRSITVQNSVQIDVAHSLARFGKLHNYIYTSRRQGGRRGSAWMRVWAGVWRSDCVDVFRLAFCSQRRTTDYDCDWNWNCNCVCRIESVNM